MDVFSLINAFHKANFKMQNIFWTAYTENDRHAAISQIQAIVAQFGGLVDMRLFSDISLALTIEIQESKIDNLYQALANLIAIDKSDLVNSISTRERTIYLNISFSKATGDLKQEVSSVPG